ncbi:DUF4148 domain-containing protein [Duganella guangzhouensis]|nr:DUF4148 domain-containing protein [Duganella guangzhouensis]
MKNLTIALSIAAAVFASSAVSAQESAEYSGYTGFVSTKTRAQVQEELHLAQQRGEIRDGEQYSEFKVDAAPAKTRAEVKAELAAYRKTHAEVSDDVAAL